MTSTSFLLPVHVFFRSSHGRCSIKKDVLKNFVKFTRKHLCQSHFFNIVEVLSSVNVTTSGGICGLVTFIEKRPTTLLKKRFGHRCFPVNFVKFLSANFNRTPPVVASDSSSVTCSNHVQS